MVEKSLKSLLVIGDGFTFFFPPRLGYCWYCLQSVLEKRFVAPCQFVQIAHRHGLSLEPSKMIWSFRNSQIKWIAHLFYFDVFDSRMSSSSPLISVLVNDGGDEYDDPAEEDAPRQEREIEQLSNS
jgi:hypothetical protein